MKNKECVLKEIDKLQKNISKLQQFVIERRVRYMEALDNHLAKMSQRVADIKVMIDEEV